MTAIERAKSLLKSAGLRVYDAGVHPDVCKSPYLVVRTDGTYSAGNRLTGYSLLDIHCYVPLSDNHTDELDRLSYSARAAMRGMVRQAVFTGDESPDMLEDRFRAYSRTLTYRVLKNMIRG